MPGDINQPARNDRIDEPARALGDEAGAADRPLVLVPLSAEDVARRRRRIHLVLWSVAVLLAVLAAYLYKRSVDPIHAQESYDAGVRLLRVASYSQAILSFDRAIALKPDFAEAYLDRGRAFIADSQTRRAIQDFSKVIELRPQDPAPLLARASASIDTKDFENAIADAGHVIAIAKNAQLRAQAYILRGVAMRATGDPQGALADFSHAIDLAPNETSYYERGATYQELGEHKLAIKDFSLMIAVRPDGAAGYFARAESLRAIGDLEAAERDFQQGRYIDGH